MESEQKNKKIFGYSKNVFFAGVVSLFMDMSSEMVYPLIPIFLTEILLVTKTTVGIIEGLAESTASILKVFSGYISDVTKKRKPLMAIGYLISSLSRILLYTSTTYMAVLTARITDRTGKGLRGAPRDALIADSTPKSELGSSFGFHRAMDTVGAMIGPLIAIIVLALSQDSIPTVFLVSFIPGVIAVGIIVLFIKEKPHQVKDDDPYEKPTLKGTSKEFKTYIVVTGLFSLSVISDAFLILRSSDLGISLTMIPVVYLLYNTIYALTSIPFGKLGDKIGLRPLITIGFIFYSLILLGFSFATNSTHIWILFILYGLYKGLSDGAGRAYVGKLCNENHKGTAFGMFHMISGIMLLPASVGAGIIWDTWGANYSFMVASIIGFTASLLFIISSRNKA